MASTTTGRFSLASYLLAKKFSTSSMPASISTLPLLRHTETAREIHAIDSRNYGTACETTMTESSESSARRRLSAQEVPASRQDPAVRRVLPKAPWAHELRCPRQTRPSDRFRCRRGRVQDARRSAPQARGMRWGRGAQAILTTRGWDQSERFDEAWARDWGSTRIASA